MEMNNKITVSTGEILYWLFFGSLLFAKGIGLYDGQLIFKTVLVFAVICLLAKLIIEKYTVDEVIKIIAVIALAGTVYLISGEKGMLLYGFMMIGMKNVNLKRLFIAGTGVWTIAFAGLTVSSLFHMDETVYKVHDKLGMGHIFRWGLGYPHPNVLHISYVVLAMFLIYVLGERFRLKHGIYLFLGNCVIFLYSVSYTGFLVFMCLLAGRLYLLFRKKLSQFEKGLLYLVFPGCVAISLIFPLVASGKVFDIVNEILSTRLELAKHYLVPEFISLFGKRASEITSRTITMDNAYLFAFITYGIIPFAILCLATIWMIHKLIKEEKYLEVLLTLVIAIGGLTEPFLYNTSFKNLSFIFMGAYLFEGKSKSGSYRLLQFERPQQFNRNFKLDLTPIFIIKEKALQFFQYGKKQVLTGIIVAVAAFFIANTAVSYPEGYVVYRVDCADLTKVKHYFGEETAEYENLKLMKDFKEGEEIEWYRGNIVLMERIRYSLLAVLFGYMLGFTVSRLIMENRNRRKKIHD